jgi:uncharacterized membrane protein (DUF485 family)
MARPPAADLPGDAALVTALMGRQARLAIAIASGFLVLMFGLPLLNALWPQGMQARILGFPFSWLLLGVLLYPVTWLLAAGYVRYAERLEAQDVALVQGRRRRR